MVSFHPHLPIRIWILSLHLCQIITKRDCSLTMKLHDKNGHGKQRNLGSLIVHAEEAISLRTAVEIVFHCKHLDNKDLLSKSVCEEHLWFIVLLCFFCLVSLIFIHSLFFVSGSIPKNIQNYWSWTSFANIQDRSCEEQFKSDLEACYSNYTAVCKQGNFSK